MKKGFRKKFKNRNIQTRPPEKKDGSFGILPPPGILESYDEIAPGSVKQIMEMVQKEQEHRHRWENNLIRAATNNHRVANLVAFILVIVIVYGFGILVHAHEYIMGVLLLLVGFGYLTLMTYFSGKSNLDKNRLDK